MSLELKLQQASSEFQQLQADLSRVVEARQRLDAQLSENELVKKVCCASSIFSFHCRDSLQEFAQLRSENVVYKLIGPVLVKQDQAEAKSNVNTRLDFIRSEMSGFPSISTNLELTISPCSRRVEGQIKDIEERQEKKKAEVSFHSCIVFSLIFIHSTVSTGRPNPNSSAANVQTSCFNTNALHPSYINSSTPMPSGILDMVEHESIRLCLSRPRCKCFVHFARTSYVVFRLRAFYNPFQSKPFQRGDWWAVTDENNVIFAKFCIKLSDIDRDSKQIVATYGSFHREPKISCCVRFAGTNVSVPCLLQISNNPNLSCELVNNPTRNGHGYRLVHETSFAYNAIKRHWRHLVADSAQTWAQW